jgi:hypothetical protein
VHQCIFWVPIAYGYLQSATEKLEYILCARIVSRVLDKIINKIDVTLAIMLLVVQEGREMLNS